MQRQRQRTHRFSGCLLVLLLCLPLLAQAGLPTVVLNDIDSPFALQYYTGYLEDPTHRLTPESLLQGGMDSALHYNTGDSFSFGISKSTFWLLFVLSDTRDPDDPARTSHLLEISYPPLDQITLYQYSGNGTLHATSTGDTLPFRSRLLAHTTYIFPLELQPGETRRFLLKVESEGSIRIPLHLWQANAFHEHNRTFLLLYGTYFGIILLMFIYNLILYAFIRDTTYLYYILYIASFLLFQSTYSGYSFQYLWPKHPQLNNPCLLAAMFLSLLFALQFSRKVLDTATTLPRLERGIRWLGLTQVLLLIITPFLHYQSMLYVALLSTLVTVSVVMVAACINSWHGLHTARLFLLAWFAFLVGTVILGSVAAGLIPANVFTSNALILGSAIEVTLLSLSLADRMYRIERERTRAEQQARQSLEVVNKTLQDSNLLKDEFLNTISHEMRTPMHGVLSSIDHIRHEPRTTQRQSFIDSAERSAQQMMLLIDSVLNYTELHASTFRLERETFTMTRLTASLAELFCRQAEDKGLQFSIHVDPEVPDLVIGDFHRIRQILVNLLSNAVKFTPQGFVRLSVSVAKQDLRTCRVWLNFDIADSGIGIPVGMESIIFDRFRQLHSGFNRGFGGLGIGLATSREIARLMQAELGYRPGDGGGTVFTFRLELPFSPASRTLSPPRDPLADWQTLAEGRHALIVEDNRVNQMVLNATLVKLGFQTQVAQNGKDALEQLLKQPVDIILMDCQMPVMDGFEATRLIRQLPPPKGLVPIIAITANAMSNDREHCVEAGMNDYMSKPVNVHELKEKLLKWLPLQPASAQEATPALTPGS